MKKYLYALLLLPISMTANAAQRPAVEYTGLGGYDYTAAGQVVRTPLESIRYADANSPIYTTSSFKVHKTGAESYYGGWWFGFGFALGNKIKPYAEVSYDIGSVIWNGATGQPLSNTDRYTAYGIRFEGEKLGIAFYKRYYYFGNTLLSAKTGLAGSQELTGFTIYFRTQ